MNKLNLFIMCFIMCFIIGCDQKHVGESESVGQYEPVKNVIETPHTVSKFIVTYEGSFTCGENDSKQKRSIYTIVDNSTGNRYLGVEGIGISSLNYNGKYSSEK